MSVNKRIYTAHITATVMIKRDIENSNRASKDAKNLKIKFRPIDDHNLLVFID